MFRKILLLAVIVGQLQGQKAFHRKGFNANKASPNASYIRTTPNPAPRLGPNEPCGDGGECVPYYMCADADTVNTDGSGIFGVRFGGDDDVDDVAEPLCKDFQLVCCDPSDITKTPIAPPHKEYKLGCGHRNVNGVGGVTVERAANGESDFGEFPWMVMIMKRTPCMTMKLYQCGGSLIHPSVVLTAAHCVSRVMASELLIRAGEWDSHTKHEIYAHEDRDVERIKVHEHFRVGPLYNDVALLFLAEAPLQLAPNINTVCLPPQDHSFDDRQLCFVSGWGKDTIGRGGRYQRILKKVELSMVEKCQATLRNTRLGYHFVLHSSFVCAGSEEGKDACTGDGGSPLVCPIEPGSNDRFYQAGVVAWGLECHQKHVPGVYGKVSLFRNWIDQQFDEELLDKKFYIAETRD